MKSDKTNNQISTYEIIRYEKFRNLQQSSIQTKSTMRRPALDKLAQESPRGHDGRFVDGKTIHIFITGV